MYDLLKTLSTLRLGPVTPDTDKCVAILRAELPFAVSSFRSGLEHNGWRVPDNWHATKAEIRRGGKVIYDGLSTPMGVIGYSDPFVGKVSLDELKRHLFFHRERPHDAVYHCDLYYKLGRSTWGFSMPKAAIDRLDPGEYEVDLRIARSPGEMKVLTCTLPGETGDTIVLNAHNCHAGQANDDISGIVVAMETMKRLSSMPRRRFSYLLVIAPEHFGTVFFMKDRSQQEVNAFRFGIFLEAVGNRNRLALQSTFSGSTYIDEAADNYMSKHCVGYERVGFRGLIGNDEVVWEAPGYEIPTIQLTRFPFEEYHSSADTAERISPESLMNTVEVLTGILEILEQDVVMKRCFTGLVALSNPRYDLYITPGTDPSEEAGTTLDVAAWYQLMTGLPRHFDGQSTVLAVSRKYGLPFRSVRQYVAKFEEKGLITTAAAPVPPRWT
jgi:aminopeptidase-like protein